MMVLATWDAPAVIRMAEPFGHRGHPTWWEKKQAKEVGQRLGALVESLLMEGFNEDEAVSFIAGVALERSTSSGETWSSPSSARSTVSHILLGGFAKAWSTDAISLAISDIAALMQKEN